MSNTGYYGDGYNQSYQHGPPPNQSYGAHQGFTSPPANYQAGAPPPPNSHAGYPQVCAASQSFHEYLTAEQSSYEFPQNSPYGMQHPSQPSPQYPPHQSVGGYSPAPQNYGNSSYPTPPMDPHGPAAGPMGRHGHAAGPAGAYPGHHDPMPQAVGNAIDSDEKGIGASLIGGSAGAFLGKKLGGSGGASLGGGVLGAVAANVLEHHEKYGSCTSQGKLEER